MDQSRALEIMLSGSNVFLTGPPGSGKTYLLKKFINECRKEKIDIAITASTGLAATHLDGQTIHSWASLMNSAINSPDEIQKARVLIIDEISMISAQIFDLINLKLQQIRNSSKPFGGLQLILVGDLFQLPPVERASNNIRLIFESNSFTKLNLRYCYLTEQHRQDVNDDLVNILMAIRNKKINQSHKERIRSSLVLNYPDDAIHLYSHNYDVNKQNITKLNAINTRWLKYEMSYSGDVRNKNVFKDNIMSPSIITLKIGSRVMFTVNDNSKKIVNGTLGKVVDFMDYKPVVRTEDGRYIRVDRHRWNFNNKFIAEQLPLKLAWAISIHKSQGMTLERAVIDLGYAFAPGMGYVALSRLRNLDSLYLLGLNSMAFVISDKAYDFDKYLKKMSKLNA